MGEPHTNMMFTGAIPVPLRKHVTSIHGFDIHGPRRVQYRALPVPILPVIISIDHDNVLRFSSGFDVEVGSFVAGLSDEAVLVEAARFTGVQVNLTPLGAWKVLGPQVADLAGGAISVEDAIGWSDGSLAERLGEMERWKDRLDYMTGLIADRLVSGPEVSPEVEHAWHLLATSDGQRSVGSVASDVGWSSRHLSTKFRAHVGMAPKRAARLLRFHAAMGLLASGTSLSEIAYICGYSDQSHFTNEVVDHTGVTPSVLRAELLDEAPVQVLAEDDRGELVE